MNNEIRFYTIKDLQTILNCSRPTVKKLIDMKEFSVIKLNKSVRINVNSFDCWLYDVDEKTAEEYRKRRNGKLPKTYSVKEFAEKLQICQKSAIKYIKKYEVDCICWNDERSTIIIPDLSFEYFTTKICA